MSVKQVFLDLAKVPRALRRAWQRVSDQRVGLLAAGVAFYGLLSLFPGIAALMALVSLWMTPQDILGAADSLRTVVPEEAAGIVFSELEAIVAAPNGGLQLAALVGFSFALYSASRAVSSLVDGVAEVQSRAPDEGWFHQFLRRTGLTFLLVCIAALTMASVVIVPVVIEIVLPTSQAAPLVALLRWPLVACFILLGISAVYHYAQPADSTPPARLRPTPGAIVASLVILPASIGFSLYLQTVGGYSATFGALGGVVTLLMWLWLSAYIVIAAAAIDAEIDPLPQPNPAAKVAVESAQAD